MFARFDENPAMTLRVIKETKRYGRTDGRTHGRTDGRTDGHTDNVKTVYPLQTKFAGGIKIFRKRKHYYLDIINCDPSTYIWTIPSFVCFVALRPKLTAMVMAGRSVHLATLFPGQA